MSNVEIGAILFNLGVLVLAITLAVYTYTVSPWLCSVTVGVELLVLGTSIAYEY